MRRSLITIALVAGAAILALGVYHVRAGEKCNTPCGTSAQASAGDACGTGKAAASCEAAGGKLTGRFDPAMSGVCRFACATKLTYDRKSVLAQPGAKTGKLTQCPVSGVVFAVDASRPHVMIGKSEYVTCCDKCAQKLKRDPRHYLKA